MHAVPPWLSGVRPALESAVPDWFATFTPPPNPARRSAVLALFGPRETGRSGQAPSGQLDPAGSIEVVLTERARGMRNHAAQVSLPGGHEDPGDGGPIGAAVREAQEEVGISPGSVAVIDTLPALYMHPSQNAVTPVLGWWTQPHPIRAVDAAEVARVVRADLEHVLDPANRFTAVAPGGYTSPGFAVDGLIIWGFTANLLDHILDLAGLTRPWDEADHRPLPDYLLRPYADLRPRE